MEDYAETITAERIKKVVQGYDFNGNKRPELASYSVNLTNLKKANKIINDWKSKDPTKFRTPEALDALKQKIYDDVLSNIPINQKSST